MKELIIKDWLWQKIAQEHHVGSVWSGHVDAVFQETEKAYKVIMGAVNNTVYTWVPKSQCEWVDADCKNHATKICESYEEAMEHVHYLRSCYC